MPRWRALSWWLRALIAYVAAVPIWFFTRGTYVGLIAFIAFYVVLTLTCGHKRIKD